MRCRWASTQSAESRRFKAWSHSDARSALASAIALNSGDARATAISAVVDAADVTTMPLLSETINKLADDSLPPDRKRAILGIAATKWSELDPPAAAKFIDAVTAGAGKMFADRYTIASNWAGVDPQAALAWAKTHDEPNSYMPFATNGAIAGWWLKDPKAAED